MSEYLTIAEVLAIHGDQINRYGGSHGVSILISVPACFFETAAVVPRLPPQKLRRLRELEP